ncbi:MAG: DUF1566 domain-containing protein [Phaeodactylibacter sp.]|nr:DUF1566 domain-containing protein [Phaeodactylibacter sp.]MCB9052836.1 DUF1566 domain-containing protein [Lewinellaceae bacterium]
MKKFLLPLLGFVFLISCGKESTTDLQPEQENYENGSATTRSSNKRDVCHNGNIINININAISAHQAHGDAVDMDGDGFFNMENDCGMPVDCDDTDDQLTDNCCNGAEIDSNGPLYVAPTDEPGLYNWQEAIDACAAKDLDGHTWYLPSKEELNHIHAAKDDIGCFTPGVYLSSTEYDGANPNYDDTYSWTQHFLTIYEGNQVLVLKSVPGPCRCVHR